MDSDDDLDIPPPKKAPVVLDDDDDLDVPIPAAAKPAVVLDDDDDLDVPPPKGGAPPLPAASKAPASPTKRAPVSGSAPPPKAQPREGWLWKQSPQWPYVSQKRWAVLKGRNLTYAETATSPVLATLDLRSVEVIKVKGKLPHSFGIKGPHFGESDRVYSFAADTGDDMTAWVKCIQLAAVERTQGTELHWFEKMAQGVY